MFVCPVCRGPLEAMRQGYACRHCAREYPIVCGIPDFRLDSDPYIAIEDDRRKGEALFQSGQGHTFEWLLRHYYAITPDDPPDLAERWTARALNEVVIADAQLRDAGLIGTEREHRDARSGGAALEPRDGRSSAARLEHRDDGSGGAGLQPGGDPNHEALLDVGCSTAALLIAARQAYGALVGVDVAFRWLVLGQRRLREAGVDATLVCANAEHLPFADAAFTAVTAMDVLEHVRDASLAAAETARVASPGAVLLATANNRYAPLPEPNVHLWGVGFLPRRWQARYVAARRRDLHPYRISLMSAGELQRLIREAGWTDLRLTPPLVVAPHVRTGIAARTFALYNRLRGAGAIGPVLKRVGPKLRIQARRAR
jgi:ubiquinone/menaquinone biosynthesis C-methylase UbiE/uncharacterized protein YbaR (Trm112 family)